VARPAVRSLGKGALEGAWEPASLLATDEALQEQRPSHLGEPLPLGEVMRILIDEQTHHGAEIALLRDLYLRRG